MYDLEDQKLLAKYLEFAVSTEKAQMISQKLLKRFGSLENVLMSDIKDLESLDFLSTRTIALIMLFNSIEKSIENCQDDDFNVLNNSQKAIIFVKSLMFEETEEKFLIVSLDENDAVINYNVVAVGNEYEVMVSASDFAQFVLNDGASSVIIAHNHPNCSAKPTTEDVDATISVLDLMRKLNLKLKDHIIIGESDTICMSEINEYKGFFD